MPVAEASVRSDREVWRRRSLDATLAIQNPAIRSEGNMASIEGVRTSIRCSISKQAFLRAKMLRAGLNMGFAPLRCVGFVGMPQNDVRLFRGSGVHFL